MKKLITAVFALALLLAAGQAMAMDKVVIGTEGAYPPFNLVDSNGELQGFDIDIAKALCESMGVECEFVIQDWDGIIPALLAKKFDCIIASMSITDERKQKVDFTDKYYISPGQFVAAKGAGIDVTGDLSGKIIGVQKATVHENFIRDNYGDVADVRAYETQEEANMDLAAGRLDLVFADKLVLLGGFIEKEEGKDFEFTGPERTDLKWFGEGIGIAVRKGETELLDMLNKAILDIRANGKYQEINAKYFPFDLYGE